MNASANAGSDSPGALPLSLAPEASAAAARRASTTGSLSLHFRQSAMQCSRPQSTATAQCVACISARRVSSRHAMMSSPPPHCRCALLPQQRTPPSAQSTAVKFFPHAAAMAAMRRDFGPVIGGLVGKRMETY